MNSNDQNYSKAALRCLFYDNTDNQFIKLFTGVSGEICNMCFELCNTIITKDLKNND